MKSGINNIRVPKIAITGGPCAGKTTALKTLKNKLESVGYTVLIANESATELISSGISPWSCGTNSDFQKCIIEYQLNKEATIEKAAISMIQKGIEKIIIVCDRGALDNKAYMSEEEYLNVLKSLSVSESELRDRYDAVFHLSLPEKQFYTTENNKARKENYSDAEKLNDRIISVWTGHTHFRVIESNNDFNLKINRLVEEIYSFLGVSGSFEIEKKFLIEYPDISLLESLPNCKRVHITQIYLTCKKEEERRIRKREIDGSCIYFQTIKRKLSSVKRIEIENRISENEYEQLLCEADRERNPIIKRRYCLTYKGQYFEIDIYPFWNDRAIIELEMLSADEKITFPPEIRIIREVTDDPSYNNSSLSFNHNILL